jgi:hypothetical protein
LNYVKCQSSARTEPVKGSGIVAMKTKRSSRKQVAGVTTQAEVDVREVELIRKVGISEQSFCPGRKQYPS